MIRISDAAQAHFAKLLANQEEGTQIRVFVINPGTPNAECGVSYCPPDAVEATDTALKFDLLTAYVDELSAPYLEDAEIDFVTDQLGSQLTLKAPNAKMRKVADDAPLMERVEYMLQSQINPHFLVNSLNSIRLRHLHAARMLFFKCLDDRKQLTAGRLHGIPDVNHTRYGRVHYLFFEYFALSQVFLRRIASDRAVSDRGSYLL